MRGKPHRLASADVETPLGGVRVNKVDEWLEVIGLQQYSDVFSTNDIGYAELKDLTEDDFRSLGVSIGHMRKMLRAVKEMRPSVSPAERRQVTVLFADIVGFTQLSTTLDPEDLLDIVNEFQTKSSNLIEDYRGMVVKFVGDGLLAFFGWPVASERDPVNCVRAARKLIEMVQNDIDAKGNRLQLRVGVSTGLAVVGDLASNIPDVFGDVPNLAARLQTSAKPGTVLISEATHSLVNHVFACDPSGPLDVKGLGEITAWRVKAERDDQEQTRMSVLGDGLMRGREAEMRKLLSLWDESKKGSFQIGCIEGEAGLGKSRLASETISQFAATTRILRLFGSPDAGQTPMHLIKDFVLQIAGLSPKDGEAIRTKRMRQALKKAGLTTAEDLAVFAELCEVSFANEDVALTPERKRALLFSGIKTLLETVSQGQPTALLVEDLHWLDPNTLELVSNLGSLRADLPMLLLATSRPEMSPPWSEQSNCTVIKLKPLSPEDSAKILQDVLGGGNDVLGNVIRKIIDRADGIPLYLEELSRSVHMTIDSLAIPSSLQDSLMARLDRLGDAKEVALAASILGRDIEESLLTEILGRDPTSVRNALDQLVFEQVLIAAEPSNFSGQQYRFRHALLQEAAYDSQLMRRRREMHSQIADILVGWLNAGKNTTPETIAYHLKAASRSADASIYFRQAGLLALTTARYEEAEKLFNSALSELANSFDGEEGKTDDAKTLELEIKTELGSVLIAREGFAAKAVGSAFEDAERLGRELGPGPALVRALWGMWLYQLVSGNLDRALELSNELNALGDAFAELDGGGLLLEASWALGNTQFWVGDLDASIENLEKSLTYYSLDAHADHALLFGQDPFVAANCYIGYTQSLRGEHSASWAAQKAAVAHAKKLNHPFTTAWSLCFPAVISVFRGEAWGALKLSEAALNHTNNQMMPFWQTAMTIVHGWAIAKTGNAEAGVQEAQAGLDFYDAIGSRTVQPFFRGLVAETYSLGGKQKEALEMIQSAFSLANETGELVSEILLHKSAAQIFAVNNGQNKAVEHLKICVELSRNKGAHAVELDAAFELTQISGAEFDQTLKDALAHAPEPRKSRTGRKALAYFESA